jgi:hypothetical protein
MFPRHRNGTRENNALTFKGLYVRTEGSFGCVHLQRGQHSLSIGKAFRSATDAPLND